MKLLKDLVDYWKNGEEVELVEVDVYKIAMIFFYYVHIS